MSNRLMTLDDGDLVELSDARGTTLRVGRGTLWLTQEDDRRDIVLAPGEAWTIERRGLTLAQAQGATSLVLSGPAANDAHIAAHRPTWKERLGAWLGRAGDRMMRRPWVPYY